MIENLVEIFKNINLYILDITGGNQIASSIIMSTVFGFLTMLSRSLPLKIWNLTLTHLTTKLTVANNSWMYEELLKYLSQNGLLKKSRYITYKDTAKSSISYGQQWFIFKGRLLSINIYTEDNKGSYREVREVIDILKFGRSHKFFNNIIQEIEEEFLDQDSKNFTKYYKNNNGYPDFKVKNPKRALDKIVLRKNIKETLIKSLDSFVHREQWYIENDIPYQFGIFLHGPPGTGKTTLIKGIAAHLNRDIVLLDSALDLAYVNVTNTDVVIVVEEIDTSLSNCKRELDDYLNKKNEEKSSILKSEQKEEKKPLTKFESDASSYVLSKVLTAMDGAIPNHGRVTIFTSNIKDCLDPAMMRPGRIDLILEISYLEKETFQEILQKFYPNQNFNLDNITLKENLSPVFVQNLVRLGHTLDEVVKECSK